MSTECGVVGTINSFQCCTLKFSCRAIELEIPQLLQQHDLIDYPFLILITDSVGYV